jgi:arsenate reductase
MTTTKKKVLVLCTGNSCRSQMAEGFLRQFAGNRAEIYSAGIEAHGVNPKAVSVMREAGVDISGHTSNKVDEYNALSFDFIITVCDHARENCPYLPGPALRFHHNFPDPAKARGSDEEILREFRSTRDMIRDYAREFAQKHLN